MWSRYEAKNEPTGQLAIWDNGWKGIAENVQSHLEPERAMLQANKRCT